MVLLIDNFDSFTYNVYQYLIQVTDQEVKVVRNNAITLDEAIALKPDYLIISPGPGRPEGAGVSLECIKYFAGKIPVLGICLGHQSIAQAFGGNIITAKNIVHGKVEEMVCDGKGVFRGIGPKASFTRYHSLVADAKTLPDCLEVTAESRDGEIMGIRHKEFDVEGVQFHPESIASEGGKRMLKNFLNYKREPFDLKGCLERVISGENLSMEEAAGFMQELTEGNLDDVTIGAFLTALNCKGIVAEEIAGCASVLKQRKVTVPITCEAVDTCGTGGDGLNTFNISSFSALIAAACGANVAKHGNRAVSSRSGSADFYSELGIPLESNPEKAASDIDNKGFSFLFAPHFHQAMKYAAPARRALKIKTIMNLVGPLSNPAGASFQIIGVWDEKLCPVMARAAKLLGVKRVMVVHGLDGIDEISISDKSRIVFIDENGIEVDYIFNPADEGIPMFKMEDLKGGTGQENADEARRILAGEGRDAVITSCCLNAGAALMVSGLNHSIAEGYSAALEAVKNGKLENKIKEITGQV